VFDVGIPDPDAGVITLTTVILAFVMIPTLGFLFWVLVRFKPQHKYKSFEIYALGLSLYFLFLNMIMWVLFPEYILNILLEYSPVWLVLILGVPVVYFKTKHAEDNSINQSGNAKNLKIENNRKASAQHR
jgi:hypothetical protein